MGLTELPNEAVDNLYRRVSDIEIDSIDKKVEVVLKSIIKHPELFDCNERKYIIVNRLNKLVDEKLNYVRLYRKIGLFMELRKTQISSEEESELNKFIKRDIEEHYSMFMKKVFLFMTVYFLSIIFLYHFFNDLYDRLYCISKFLDVFVILTLLLYFLGIGKTLYIKLLYLIVYIRFR